MLGTFSEQEKLLHSLLRDYPESAGPSLHSCIEAALQVYAHTVFQSSKSYVVFGAAFGYTPEFHTELSCFATYLRYRSFQLRRSLSLVHSKSNKYAMTRNWCNQIPRQISPSKPKREINELQIVKIQRAHMVNRVSNSFPKGGHSATQTEQKII